MKLTGIITGDIVKSSRIKKDDRNKLLTIIKNIPVELENISPTKIEIYRGDSFQILVEKSEQVLKIAILIRAKLRSCNKGWDARLAIGVGKIDFEAENVLMSDGEAFQNSGREFEDLGKSRLAIRTSWSEANDELRVSTAFADYIITKWTMEQAQAVFQVLSLPLPKILQEDVAKKLGNSIANTSKLLSRASEKLIKNYIDRFENIVTNHSK